MPERIFWLGMHKVLKTTELRQLRAMGYEVFNPAYLSPIYDQSADRTVDRDQPSTLPPEVFKKLISYDFFYRPIDEEIGELLNAYFDVVIVTINGLWLRELLKVYRGKVVYRIYGQHFLLSRQLAELGLVETLVSRPDFHIVPFAPESVEFEERWFRDLVFECVPYQIPDDAFETPFRWEPAGRRMEIASSFPNIENPYYAAAYAQFADRFKESYFRIYGPQRRTPPDRRIIGALSRPAFFQYLSQSAAYYYNYSDSVCYLPPIEFMQLGGPVVCAPGSLLAKFFEPGAPNVAFGVADAKERLERLLDGDPGFAAELIAAQEPVRRRYDRGLVQAAFERTFRRLLDAPAADAAPAAWDGTRLRLRSADDGARAAVKRRVLLALHIDGLYVYRDGETLAFEGIPRVLDFLARAICTAGPAAGIVITTTRRSLPTTMDYFRRVLPPEKVDFLVVDERDTKLSRLQARLRLIERIDADETITTVVVPHYYLFPEFIQSRKRTVMTFFDFYPHLMPHEVFDTSFEQDAENKALGVALSRKSDVILTASEFTRRYLPDAGFGRASPPSEFMVFPIPTLGAGRDVRLTDAERRVLVRTLGPSPFLFYPTANRPNKKLVFLAQLFAEVRLKHPDMRLVLTCDLGSVPGVTEAFRDLDLLDHLVFIHQASEGLLRWLYANCRALCLTSTLEGNFPPQVTEAVAYGAPVVATRLPQIDDELGRTAEDLLLCRPLRLDDFAEAVERAITERDAVLQRQERVRTRLAEIKAFDVFRARVLPAFPELAQAGPVA